MAPTTQKAIVVKECGGIDKLQLVEDWPYPDRKAGEVLIKLTSTSVNPVDTYIRSGIYTPTTFPKVPGGDIAGIVEAADEDSKFKPGDKVFALTMGFFNEVQNGSYLQYASVAEKDVAPIPGNLPVDEAGAVPLVALTAWQALEPLGSDASGKRVLVTAAAGGVGHIAVQLAKARGAYVVGTAGPDNQTFLKEIGVDEPIDYHVTDIHQRYGDDLFDLVVDVVGGPDNMPTLYSLVKPGGTFTHVFNRGTNGDALQEIKQKSENSDAPKLHTVLVHPDGPALEEISKLIENGKVKVHIAEKFPLERVADAHAKVETWHVRGKIALTI